MQLECGNILTWLIVCFVYIADPNTLRYFYNLGFQVRISTELNRHVILDGELKRWFPLSRNFLVRTCVKFPFANRIEAMYERSHVSVKVEPRSTSRLISALYILPLFCVRDKNLRALTCVTKNASVEINLEQARRFWATHANQKWTSCIFGQCMYANFRPDRLYESKTLSKTNLIASRHIRKGKASRCTWRASP